VGGVGSVFFPPPLILPLDPPPLPNSSDPFPFLQSPPSGQPFPPSSFFCQRCSLLNGGSPFLFSVVPPSRGNAFFSSLDGFGASGGNEKPLSFPCRPLFCEACLLSRAVSVTRWFFAADDTPQEGTGPHEVYFFFFFGRVDFFPCARSKPSLYGRKSLSHLIFRGLFFSSGTS